MAQAIDKTANYRSYIRAVLRMYVFTDADKFDTDAADVLREQMVEPWYALSQVERKRMDGLVMDLNELRESRKNNEPKQLTEEQNHQGLITLQQIVGLKEEGKYDVALDLLREWQHKMVRQFVWYFRGSVWNAMEVPEVAVEFFREAKRLDPNNEKFAGVYLNVLKGTNFDEAKRIADKVLARPEKRDLTLVVYATDVEMASIDEEGFDANERSRRMARILERVLSSLLGGEVKSHGNALVGMAGILLSTCYVNTEDTERAYSLLSFMIHHEPENALLFAARGKLNFPTKAEAAMDLRRALDLGLPMAWPYVWLARYYLEDREFAKCREACDEGLARKPLAKVRSELLEFKAIAQASSNAPENEVRELFNEAIRADISNDRAVHNLTVYNSLTQGQANVVTWERRSPFFERNPQRIEEKEIAETLRQDLSIVA